MTIAVVQAVGLQRFCEALHIILVMCVPQSCSQAPPGLLPGSLSHVARAAGEPGNLTTCTIQCVYFILQYYIIITIVQSYTGKYHEFVAVCIVTSVQHE